MSNRPPHLRPPAYLSRNTPVPQPAEVPAPVTDPLDRSPVRYGDWTLKGIAVDF